MKVFIPRKGLETVSKEQSRSFEEQLEERTQEVDGQRGMEHASVLTSNVSDNSIYDVHLCGSAK